MTSTIATKQVKKLTPMMEQFMATKEAHPDCLLFYRMGDFYELFFDDAIIAADILKIALTTRGKHLGEDIPMCGVPHHSSDSYLLTLIRSGHRVAICEQMESPAEAKKRGYKAVVRREVIRIVTPGTITEDSLLESTQSNYLATLTKERQSLAMAWVDISTGCFFSCPTATNQLVADISRINPKELLVDESLYKNQELASLLGRYKSIAVPYSPNLFSASRGENRLKEFYEVKDLSSFGDFTKGEVGALGAVIEYIELTQKGNKPYISAPLCYEQKNFMVIDGATRKNLEITESLSGNKKTSLLSVINQTKTSLGARLLTSYLENPLCYASGINERLNMVEFFVANESLRQNVRELLQKIPDMERSVSRITLRRGGPRDLANISVALFKVMEIAELLEFAEGSIPSGVINIKRKLNPHDDLCKQLYAALRKESLPALTRDGGFIDTEYHPKIKELRLLQQNGADALQKLKEQYQQETGITSLKVTKNNVIGYYIEVPAAQSKKMDLERFIHKQSMVNAVRYTTPELQRLEEDIVTASDKILNLELELFDQLVVKVIEYADTLSLTSQGLAELDVMASLAELAVSQNYVKPVIDDSHAFIIEKGRHPVVEKNIMGELENDFIPNDCDLSDLSKIWLLTGPNMAGKSTFLRQNALITILAQIGSYVPAKHAHIGTVDRLFSRIGASDDLARGRSTFMVEMTETATILNQSTNKSLVILDEIGRGTATYDGLAIAWSVLEYLHNSINCRGLFATHYHELTRLADELKHIASYTVQVKEWGEKIVFLHQVIKGAAEKSYGIHVGKLAGLPPYVIKRATQILEQVTQNAPSHQQDLPLFSNATDNVDTIQMELSEVEEKLQSVDIDALSPREALDVLYELKELTS